MGMVYIRRHCFIVSAAGVHVNMVSGHCAVYMYMRRIVSAEQRRLREFRFEPPQRPSPPYRPRLDNIISIFYIMHHTHHNNILLYYNNYRTAALILLLLHFRLIVRLSRRRPRPHHYYTFIINIILHYNILLSSYKTQQ